MRNEMDVIKDQKKLQGFSSDNVEILSLKSVQLCMNLYMESIFPTNEITAKAINPKKIVKVAKSLFLKLLSNVDRNVLFFPLNEVSKLQNLAIRNGYTEEQFINAYNSLTKMIDIFDIPVNYSIDGNRNGNYKSADLLSSEDDLLNKLRLVVSEINLDGPSDYLMITIYLHELIHVLLKRFKGIIGDYNYSEFLPIFFERVFTLHLDSDETLLNKELLRRNINTKSVVNLILKGDKHGRVYLISTLLANILFKRYYKYSDSEREKLLLELQLVLNGKKSIPVFLKEQGVDLNSEEVINATQFVIDNSMGRVDQKLTRNFSNPK